MRLLLVASPAVRSTPLSPSARSVTGLFEWRNIWIYLVADFIGGAVAAFVFLFVLPAEKEIGDIEAASTE